MYKLLSFEISRIRKRLIFLIVYVAFFILVAYYSMRNAQLFNGVFISYLSSLLGLGIVYFVFFAFFAYDYFSELYNVQAEEMVLSIPKAQGRILINQTLITVFLILISCLPSIISLSSVLNNADLPSAKYTMHALLAILRYIALPSLLGVFLGLALRGRGRALAYVLITVFTLLGSGYLSSFTQNLSIANFEVASILDLFQITAPDARFAADGVYGIPLELSRIVNILFWLTLLLLVSVLKTKFSNKNIKRVTASVIGIVCLSLFISFSLKAHHSVKYTGDRQSSYMDNPESQYYQENRADINAIEADFTSNYNEFQVEEYSINIQAAANLKADVTVKLDNPELNKYLFTLHHSYQINTITDKAGRAIPFTRAYDYIIIEPRNHTDEINFKYKGISHSKYFVNHQNMTLPAYHIYYPRAGFYHVWDYDLDNYKVNTEFQESDYLIKVQANYQVESNLEKIASDTFQGKAESVSLFGGFLERVERDGQSYIYGPMSGQRPYFDTRKARELSEKVNEITDLDLPVNYADKNIFMTHIMLKQSNGAEEMALFPDHIILSDIQPNPEAILHNHLNRELKGFRVSDDLKGAFVKKLLYGANREVSEKPSYDALAIIDKYEKLLAKNYYEFSEEELNFYDEAEDQYWMARDEFTDLLDYQMNVLGEEYVLKKIYEYIQNEDSSTSYIDFIFYME